MKTLLLTLTVAVGLTMMAIASRADDGTNYTPGWGKYNIEKSTLRNNQEGPAATPSQDSVVYPDSRPDKLAKLAPQLYARPASTPAPGSQIEMLPPKSVVSSIKSNRWTATALIVAGTLTNTNAVPVKITKISATGFNKNRKAVIDGSDFTITHNELAPGETVNFKVALKDDAKQVKFVKLTPYVVRP
jgi:hypothetical protein